MSRCAKELEGIQKSKVFRVLRGPKKWHLDLVIKNKEAVPFRAQRQELVGVTKSWLELVRIGWRAIRGG